MSTTYDRSTSFTSDSYAASLVHRFYQMWQQLDCDAADATSRNPSGCKSDLFTWTEVTVGSNVNGLAQPANFSTDYLPTAKTTGEGGTGLDSIMLAFGDAIWFSDAGGNPATPPHNQLVWSGTAAVAMGTRFTAAGRIPIARISPSPVSPLS